MLIATVSPLAIGFPYASLSGTRNFGTDSILRYLLKTNVSILQDSLIKQEQDCKRFFSSA
jgi:hypothetical protein